MNALWKIYLDGKWGWERDYGFVVAPFDDLAAVKGRGRGWASVDLVLQFDRVPGIDVLRQAADAFDEWFAKVYRPSRFERDRSKR